MSGQASSSYDPIDDRLLTYRRTEEPTCATKPKEPAAAAIPIRPPTRSPAGSACSRSRSASSRWRRRGRWRAPSAWRAARRWSAATACARSPPGSASSPRTTRRPGSGAASPATGSTSRRSMTGYEGDNPKRDNVTLALAAVAGVTALDVYCAPGAGRANRRCRCRRCATTATAAACRARRRPCAARPGATSSRRATSARPEAAAALDERAPGRRRGTRSAGLSKPFRRSSPRSRRRAPGRRRRSGS